MSKMDDLDLLSQNVAEGGDITMFPYMYPGIMAASVVGTVLASAVTVIAAKRIAKQLKAKQQERDSVDEEI